MISACWSRHATLSHLRPAEDTEVNSFLWFPRVNIRYCPSLYLHRVVASHIIKPTACQQFLIILQSSQFSTYFESIWGMFKYWYSMFSRWNRTSCDICFCLSKCWVKTVECPEWIFTIREFVLVRTITVQKSIILWVEQSESQYWNKTNIPSTIVSVQVVPPLHHLLLTSRRLNTDWAMIIKIFIWVAYLS